MIHAVKCYSEFFEELMSGEKSFEVRKGDRPYEVGDYLAVNEFIPDNPDPYDDYWESPNADRRRKTEGGRYSGRCMLFEITYVMKCEEYTKEGMFILGIRGVEIGKRASEPIRTY